MTVYRRLYVCTSFQILFINNYYNSLNHTLYMYERVVQVSLISVNKIRSKTNQLQQALTNVGRNVAGNYISNIRVVLLVGRLFESTRVDLRIDFQRSIEHVLADTICR